MWFVVALAVFCALYNNVFNLFRPAVSYVPVNLAVAALLVAAARWQSLTWRDIGVGSESVGSGLRWGAPIALVIAAGLALAYVLPFGERFLSDARVASLGGSALTYQALVRVPLGTVVLEEVAFRGVLYGAWSRQASVTAAVIGSCAVFGLWHIVPALDMWRINDMTPPAVLFVAGSVVVTALGGAVLVWLRIRTGGILAPALVHAAANSLGTVAAAFAQRA